MDGSAAGTLGALWTPSTGRWECAAHSTHGAPIPAVIPNMAIPCRGRAPRILVVDDDTFLRDLLQRAISGAGYEVDVAASAAAALWHISNSRFDLILTDVYLPDMSGFELFNRLLGAAPGVPVIMLTGFGDAETARQATRVGVADFLLKPCKLADLLAVVQRHVPAPQPLTHDVDTSDAPPSGHERERVLDALLSALETHDTEPIGHSERVTAYTMMISDRMRVGKDELYHIERGALLHDIGRIAVPDRILLKPGPLTDEEWLDMRKHPMVGYKMCSNVPFLRMAARIILHHHERWDGSGYPNGLRGTEIPLGSRIFAVADTLESMTSERPWRPRYTLDEARREIERNAGLQFDPAVVDAFLQISATQWERIRAQARRRAAPSPAS